MRSYFFGYFCLFLLLSVTAITSNADDDDHEDDHHEDDGDHDDYDRPGHSDSPTKHKHYNDEGEHDDDYDHEAVLGSHEDYDDLSPEDAKERLGELITKMDTNKDKSVNREELIAWITNSFKNLDAEDARNQVKEADLNGDNKISLDEALQSDFKHKEADIPTLEKATDKKSKNIAKAMREEKERFVLADLNKDGLLNDEEFKAFWHPHNYEHMAPVEVKRTLEESDKNKDKKLSLEEFLGDKLDNNSKQEETNNFKKLDINKDGFLDQAEIAKWVVPGLDAQSIEEADHLIKETDANKDKILSRDEILNKHDLWVGSQATNYGKHLRDEL